MELFFDGMNQENSKTSGGKGRNFFLKWRKEKEEIFYVHTWRFPYSCVLHPSETPSPSCDPPSGEPTHHMGTSPTT